MLTVHRNLGLFGLAVLIFLICVYMNADRPEHRPEKIADLIPWSDQLGTVKSFIASLIKQLNDEKAGVPPAGVSPVYKTDHDTDYKSRSDPLTTQPDKSYAEALLNQLNSEKAQQDDPRLIKLIRDHFIEPPSPLSYNLNKPERKYYAQKNQSAIVDGMLNNTETGFFVECGAFDGEQLSNTLYFEKTRHWKGLLIEANPTNYAELKKKNRNAFTINACLSVEKYPVKETGFFVECGAFDGEQLSNTLYFEKTRHWKGLLIEANPTNYAELKKKNRNAFTINACLSVEKYPVKMAFNKHGPMGRLLHDEGRLWMEQRGFREDEIQIQCFPLYSILLALNQTNVDYLSLDIEGDELYVLKTVPFDKLHFKLMTVEVGHPANRSVEMKEFMRSQGYQYARKIIFDLVFVNKDT